MTAYRLTVTRQVIRRYPGGGDRDVSIEFEAADQAAAELAADQALGWLVELAPKVGVPLPTWKVEPIE